MKFTMTSVKYVSVHECIEFIVNYYHTVPWNNYFLMIDIVRNCPPI